MSQEEFIKFEQKLFFGSTEKYLKFRKMFPFGWVGNGLEMLYPLSSNDKDFKLQINDGKYSLKFRSKGGRQVTMFEKPIPKEHIETIRYIFNTAMSDCELSLALDVFGRCLSTGNVFYKNLE